MNETNVYGQPEAGPGGGAWPQQPPMAGNSLGQYKFSPAELQVLQECNRESFMQRSMPLATVLGLGAAAAVQRGYLKPNPRFGAFPKVTLAVVMGYFIGKLSYQQACAEKLMNLPGSYIGQLLRDRRDGKTGGTLPPNKSSGTMFGATSGDIYSDAGPGSSLDLDTDRPLFSEDSYRPDQNAGQSAADSPPRPALSYDDLRRKNRNEFADVKQDPYRVEPSARRQPPPPPPPPPPPGPAPRPYTNQYGDLME